MPVKNPADFPKTSTISSTLYAIGVLDPDTNPQDRLIKMDVLGGGSGGGGHIIVDYTDTTLPSRARLAFNDSIFVLSDDSLTNSTLVGFDDSQILLKADYDSSNNGFIDRSAGGLNIDTSGLIGIPFLQAASTTVLKYELLAGSPPGINQDSAAGYSVGSRVIHAGNEWVCTDASIGAAVWASTTITAGGGSAHVIQSEGNSLPQRSKLNFIGTGLTGIYDDAPNDATVIQIEVGDMLQSVYDPDADGIIGLEQGGLGLNAADGTEGYFYTAGTPNTGFVLRTNLLASSNPGIDDDASLGYAPSSWWINQTDGGIFVCTDATIGGAAWSKLATGSGSIPIEAKSIDSPADYAIDAAEDEGKLLYTATSKLVQVDGNESITVGWYCYIQPRSDATVTLQGINGASITSPYSLTLNGDNSLWLLVSVDGTATGYNLFRLDSSISYASRTISASSYNLQATTDYGRVLAINATVAMVLPTDVVQPGWHAYIDLQNSAQFSLGGTYTASPDADFGTNEFWLLINPTGATTDWRVMRLTASPVGLQLRSNELLNVPSNFTRVSQGDTNGILYAIATEGGAPWANPYPSKITATTISKTTDIVATPPGSLSSPANIFDRNISTAGSNGNSSSAIMIDFGTADFIKLTQIELYGQLVSTGTISVYASNSPAFTTAQFIGSVSAGPGNAYRLIDTNQAAFAKYIFIDVTQSHNINYIEFYGEANITNSSYTLSVGADNLAYKYIADPKLIAIPDNGVLSVPFQMELEVRAGGSFTLSPQGSVQVSSAYGLGPHAGTDSIWLLRNLGLLPTTWQLLQLDPGKTYIGNGWLQTATKTTNYTANNRELIPCNTTANGAFSVTLPTSGEVQIVDVAGNSISQGFGIQNLTVLPASGSGHTIMGDASLVLDRGAIGVWLRLFGTDWRIMNG